MSEKYALVRVSIDVAKELDKTAREFGISRSAVAAVILDRLLISEKLVEEMRWALCPRDCMRKAIALAGKGVMSTQEAIGWGMECIKECEKKRAHYRFK